MAVPHRRRVEMRSKPLGSTALEETGGSPDPGRRSRTPRQMIDQNGKFPARNALSREARPCPRQCERTTALNPMLE
jgi:hypothetical protein